MVYEIIVVTLLLPYIGSTAVILLELLASGNNAGDGVTERPAWLAGGVAAVGSYWLAYSLYSWTEVAPADAWHWLPHAVFGVTATALLAAMAGRAWACVIVLPTVLAFAWLLTPAWDEVARIRPWVSSGLAAAMLAYLALAWPLGDRKRANQSWVIGLVLVGHLLAAAVIIQCSGWTSLAQLTAVPIIALSVQCIASCPRPYRQFLYGAIPAFAVIFPASLLLAWYSTFTSISLWAFILPALGPIMLVSLTAFANWIPTRLQLPAFATTLLLPLTGAVVAVATAG